VGERLLEQLPSLEVMTQVFFQLGDFARFCHDEKTVVFQPLEGLSCVSGLAFSIPTP
jgi:hypothetical protein